MKMCFFDGVKTRKVIWLFSGGYRCSHHKETFNRILLNNQISPNESYSHVTYLGSHTGLSKSICAPYDYMCNTESYK
jgi:hypothetical protein